MVDAQGDITNSITGELMITLMQELGISGLIVDGAIRDLGAIKEMDFPVYAAGVQPKGPYKDGPGEINVPISCGGVVVNPGDILVGDDDAVVAILPKDAPELLQKAKATVAKEAGIMESIKNNKWDRSWVDKVLREKDCEFIDD